MRNERPQILFGETSFRNSSKRQIVSSIKLLGPGTRGTTKEGLEGSHLELVILLPVNIKVSNFVL